MQLLTRKKIDIPSSIAFSDEKGESCSTQTPSSMESEGMATEEATKASPLDRLALSITVNGKPLNEVYPDAKVDEVQAFLDSLQHQQGINGEGDDNEAVAVVETVDEHAEKRAKSFIGRFSTKMGRTSMKCSKKAIASPLKRSKKKVSAPLLKQSTPPKTANAMKKETKTEISSPNIDSRSLIVPESSKVDTVQEEVNSPASSVAASEVQIVVTSVATPTDAKETGKETNEVQIDATGELGIEIEEEVAAVPANEEEALPMEEEAALLEKERENAASAIEDASRVEESAPAKKEVTSPVEEEAAPPAEEEGVAALMKEAVAPVEESAPAKEEVSSSAEEEVAAPIEEEVAADPMEEVAPAEEVAAPPAEENLENAPLEKEAPPSEVETPSEENTRRSETDTCRTTLCLYKDSFDNSINFEPSIETVEQDDAILVGFFPPEAPEKEPKDACAFDFNFSKLHMMIGDVVVQTKELGAQGMGMLNCCVNDAEEQDNNNDIAADSSPDSRAIGFLRETTSSFIQENFLGLTDQKECHCAVGISYKN